MSFLRYIHEPIGHAWAYSRKRVRTIAKMIWDFLNSTLRNADIAIKTGKWGILENFLLPSQSNAVLITALMAVEKLVVRALIKTNWEVA
jgi:hypothetical protein